MSVANLKETVTDLFSGNPFATEVGHKIEQATDPKLGAENWALFMEICDLVNESEESAKDAARAIKKRLHVVMPAKDFEAAQLVVTVLETCVKNCHKRFQAIVCSKDYVQDLVKAIGPGNKPPVMLQERVLGLVQSWAETFRSSPDLRGVTEVYDELKAKGVDFPVLDMDAQSPIITPQKSVNYPSQPATTPRRSSMNNPPAQNPAPVPLPLQHHQIHQQDLPPQGYEVYPTGGPVTLTPEQLTKMRQEVDVVKGNLQVFTEMLGEMKPGQEDPDDLQLLIDLHNTIRSMQDRIVQLLGSVNNEEVTAELLLVNDEMNSLFLRYERYERQRKGAAIQSRALPPVPTGQIAGRSEAPPSRSSTLIDFSAEKMPGRSDDFGALQSEMGAMALNRTTGNQHSTQAHDSDSEDFGAFAMSRVGHPPAAVPVGPASGPIPKENELSEMESWLKSQPPTQQQPSQADRPALSSSEFDKFLESRVLAAEHLPSVAASNRGGNDKPKDKEENSHLLD